MSDRVFLEGLVLRAFHGCHEAEARDGQDFVLDVELELDLARAASSDDLAATVSYDDLLAVTSAAFCGRRCNLIEAAAGAVADALLAAFPLVEAVQVCVRKPHAPLPARFAAAGVRLVRRRVRA